MLIHMEKKTISGSDSAWSSGEISKNTDHRLHAMLQQIFVKANTSTTTFKFQIIDYDSRIIYDSENFSSGTLNETNTTIPLKGTYTLKIYSSSLEEDFKIMLSMKEDY